MMDDLEKQGWPVDQGDINLLEREIEQAQTFLLQSKDLRQKSEEVWLTQWLSIVMDIDFLFSISTIL